MGVKSIYLAAGHSEADAAGAVGKIVNAYNTYANALLHGSSGLLSSSQLYSINGKTGKVTEGVSQTAKTAGLTIDNNGILAFGVDDSLSEIYLMSQAGRWQTPRRVPISSTGSDLESESSSSTSEILSSSSSSSSSSSNSSSSSSSSLSSSSEEYDSYSSSSSSSSSSSEGTSSSSNSSSSTSEEFSSYSTSSSSSSSSISTSSSSSISESSSSSSFSSSSNSSSSSSESSQSLSSSSSST